MLRSLFSYFTVAIIPGASSFKISREGASLVLAPAQVPDPVTLETSRSAGPVWAAFWTGAALPSW